MKPGTPALRSTRLLDQLRERMRYLQDSLQTEKAHLYWVRFCSLDALAGLVGPEHSPKPAAKSLFFQ